MNDICSYCGCYIGDISKYRIGDCCPKCGARVEEDEEEDTSLAGFSKFRY